MEIFGFAWWRERYKKNEEIERIWREKEEREKLEREVRKRGEGERRKWEKGNWRGRNSIRERKEREGEMDNLLQRIAVFEKKFTKE